MSAAMDLGFFRRLRADAAGRSTAPLDFGVLTATLHTMQAASVTARMQAQAPRPDRNTQNCHAPLVELLLGGPGWKAAVEQQGGSFNPLYARHGGGNA
jgi:hypothetical protein